jgi:hypothetical protein
MTSSPISGFAHDGLVRSRDLGAQEHPTIRAAQIVRRSAVACALPPTSSAGPRRGRRHAARNTSSGKKTDRSEREHSGTPWGLSRGTRRRAGASPVRLARRLLAVVSGPSALHELRVLLSCGRALVEIRGTAGVRFAESHALEHASDRLCGLLEASLVEVATSTTTSRVLSGRNTSGVDRLGARRHRGWRLRRANETRPARSG